MDFEITKQSITNASMVDITFLGIWSIFFICLLYADLSGKVPGDERFRVRCMEFSMFVIILVTLYAILFESK